MCGIIGILGTAPVADRMVDALKKLEYRGYDSAGIAVLDDKTALSRRRALGKLNALTELLENDPIDGLSGIGHTRWATHGEPSVSNAHPHMTDRVALVHNGIIENFRELRTELDDAGIQCEGETDTEIVTRLIDLELSRGKAPFDAFQTVLNKLTGAFALGVIISGADNLMLAARRGSPLVVGFGDGENYIGSDAIALSALTNRVVYLEEGDMAAITRDDVKIFDENGTPVQRSETITQVTNTTVNKGNHRHFMQKEIFEQPTVISQTLSRYIDQSAGDIKLPDMPFDLSGVSRITIIACGTAYYAGAIARYWFEQIAGIATECDIASEFRYRNPVMDQSGLTVFVSQSGETADTLAALRLAKEKGQKIAAVVNVETSTMAREADVLLPTFAGPEIGVASTKAFTCQLSVLAALALALGKAKGTLDSNSTAKHLKDLNSLPTQLAKTLTHDEKIKNMAETMATASDALFVGRGSHFPLAMEGALKLKEISYIHAEGYAAGELKHGPIALVDEKVPVIGIAPSHELYDKTVSNLQEIEARKGRVILISDELDGHDENNFIPMPKASALTSPILYAIPIQLLAYYTAVAKGTDVDQPRNLAKSVTVE